MAGFLICWHKYVLKYVYIHMNILFRNCKKHSVVFWKCPHFLFSVMGTTTIVSMLTTFGIVRFYNGGPEIMIISVFIVSLAVFIPGSLMVRSFEYLAEANRMKSEFVSIASHQLRSPMSAIKWSLDLLLSKKLGGKLDEKQKEHLNIVEENNNRMIKLVNDLLNVSRIDKNELTLKREKLELKEEIEKNINILQPIADSRNIKLIFETDLDQCYIIGDEVYIGMIINNLIDNAIKYSKDENGTQVISEVEFNSTSETRTTAVPRRVHGNANAGHANDFEEEVKNQEKAVDKKDGGGSVVKIRLNKKDGRVKFEVSDNGIGISGEDEKRVFDKFFRAENAKTQQVSGTGLGLFIVKSVIKQMNGIVGFETKEGEGSTFWFEVPILVTSN